MFAVKKAKNRAPAFSLARNTVESIAATPASEGGFFEWD
jgi:hypothetical protein